MNSREKNIKSVNSFINLQAKGDDGDDNIERGVEHSKFQTPSNKIITTVT